MPANRPHLVVTTVTTLSLVFALAACSTTGSATSSASAGVAAATASASAAVTDSASASAEASTGAGAGASAAGDACAVLPVQDVQTALGASGVTAKPVPGGSDYSGCSYQTADGQTVAATTYTPQGGAGFDTYKSAQGAVQIPGVGDGAVFVNPILFVKKGNALLAVQLTQTADLSPDKLQQIVAALGAAVAGHM
jgi:hypothetical protein